MQWTSFDPNTGNQQPYMDTNLIEEAFLADKSSIYLEKCFNATIYLTYPQYQTTPAVGSKPIGWRSVMRGTVGTNITIYWDTTMEKWTIYSDQYSHTKQLTIEAYKPTPVAWQWCDREYHASHHCGDKNWHNYSTEINAIIEDAYQTRIDHIDINVGLTGYRIRSFSGTYAIQENIKTGIVRMIRRSHILPASHCLPDELSDESCALCLESFSETLDFPIRKTQCGHYFHWTCLNSYKQHGHRCPMCRQNL